MALNFFKQRDIDRMDPQDIPEEFINYFESLPIEKQRQIIESRPELAEGLGFLDIAAEVTEADTEEIQDDVLVEDYDLSASEEDDSEIETDEEETGLTEIVRNHYAGMDLLEIMENDFEPVYALTIPDDAVKCPIHRLKFDTINVKYQKILGTYGVNYEYCKKCNRLYIRDSRKDIVHEKLTLRDIQHTFYDKEMCLQFYAMYQTMYEMDPSETIYIPDEKNFSHCPSDQESLDFTPCVISYQGRKIDFLGYRCEKCHKLYMSKAAVLDLEDGCAVNGIPSIHWVKLESEKKKKKKATAKVMLAYDIDSGIRREAEPEIYHADRILSEEDTVVISDIPVCDVEKHESDVAYKAVLVRHKHTDQRVRKSYRVEVGYCKQCKKYYMRHEDYQALIAYGRPEMTVVNYYDDALTITSGETYRYERKHLDHLEDDLQKQIDDIKGQSDYVSQYAVNRYDDDNLAYNKGISKRKYEPLIQRINEYAAVPYVYRVDLVCDDQTETYYLGASDITVDDKLQVLSYNSTFGHKIANVSTQTVIKENKEYRIKLNRRFDIENAFLFGYENIKTDEDSLYRKGITDPFLIRVLKMRKQQHNLIDIIATIQENQNTIVDAGFNKNLIVQGCAGSGKTMVLLHRLSALKYRRPGFNFENDALILTPNQELSLHIKGLAEGLQIGNIDRKSVEEYYSDILGLYSKELQVSLKAIASEENENQIFVNYVYSDAFKRNLDQAFQKVIDERYQISEKLTGLAHRMGQKINEHNLSDNSVAVARMQISAGTLYGTVRPYKERIEAIRSSCIETENKKQETVNRCQYIEYHLPIVIELAAAKVLEGFAYIEAKEEEAIDSIYEEIESLSEKKKSIQSKVLILGKARQIREVDEQIHNLETEASNIFTQIEKEKTFIDDLNNCTNEEKTITWLKESVQYVQEVQQDIDVIDKWIIDHQRLEGYVIELEESIARLNKEEENLLGHLPYSLDLIDEIYQIKTFLDEETLLNTFTMIFDKAIEQFVESNGIQVDSSKIHRYDLYARLLIAIKYFKKHVGTTDFMCIDEGQDLTLNEYILLKEMNPSGMIFNIYGDTNQMIKPGRGIQDWNTLIPFFNASLYTLNENYRNTNQITAYCNDKFEMDVHPTGVDGKGIRTITRRDLDDELSYLEIHNERIAILVPRSVQKSQYLNKKKIQNDNIKISTNKIEQDAIALMYVDEVKGIEFDRVYVVHNTMSRNEKYIAYTRALSELIVVNDASVKAEKTSDTKSVKKKNDTISKKTKAKQTKSETTPVEQLDLSEALLEDALSEKQIAKTVKEEILPEKLIIKPVVEEVFPAKLIAKPVMEDVLPENLIAKSEVEEVLPAKLIIEQEEFTVMKQNEDNIAVVAPIISETPFTGEVQVEPEKTGGTEEVLTPDKENDVIDDKEQQKKSDTPKRESGESTRFVPVNDNSARYHTTTMTQEELYKMFEEYVKGNSSIYNTAKYAFLLALIECAKNSKSNRVSFNPISMAMAEWYWPLVVNYELNQSMDSNKEDLEAIFTTARMFYMCNENTKFSTLKSSQTKTITDQLKDVLQKQTIKNFYNSTKGLVYSYSLQEKWVELNPEVRELFVSQKSKLYEMIITEWASYMEQVNDKLREKTAKSRCGSKIEGKGAKLYRKILQSIKTI